MPAGVTYEPIATTTLTSTQSTVSFNSIPSTYTDLVAIVNAISSNVADYDLCVRMNSDSGANYSQVRMYASGTSGAMIVDTGNNQNFAFCGRLNQLGGPNTINFFDYTNTVRAKQVVGLGGNTDLTLLVTSTWENTSAITSLTFLPYLNSFVAGSIFTLYGIAAA